MDINEWIGKQVRVSLEGGKYYRGFALSVGEDFLKIRDFRDKTVFIRVNQITIIEEWEG